MDHAMCKNVPSIADRCEQEMVRQKLKTQRIDMVAQDVDFSTRVVIDVRGTGLRGRKHGVIVQPCDIAHLVLYKRLRPQRTRLPVDETQVTFLATQQEVPAVACKPHSIRSK